MKNILFIPDTQVKKGVDTSHILAAGRYVLKHRPDVIIFAGDHWDCPSLNKYASNLEIESQRILEDIEAGNKAMQLFLSPMRKHNSKQRKNKKKIYSPRMIYLVGNHDPQVRIPRMIEDFPVLDGFLKDTTTPFLEGLGFEVYPFLEVVNVEGIRFSHYFINPHSAKKTPLSGNIDTMMKNAGFSFVQGHTQTFKMGKHYLADGTRRLGIVAGAFYQHHEKYMGVQGNPHWRGMIMLHGAENGCADICEINMDWLMEKYL